MILWFVLTLELSARLQITRKCISTDWKTLGKKKKKKKKKTVGKFTSKFWPWRIEKEFSQSNFFLFSPRRLQISNCSLINNKTKTQGEKFLLLFLSKKMEFRTYFALSHTFSQNWIQSLTNSFWVWASCYNVDVLLSIARRLSSRVAIFTPSRVFHKLCSY